MINSATLLKYYRFPERALSYLFYKNGFYVASCPWPFIVASLLLFFVTSAGMLQIQTEKPEDIWHLYFPKGSPATEGSYRLEQDFPSHSSDNYWPFQDTGDVLSLNALFLVEKDHINFTQVLKNVRTSCDLVQSFVTEIDGQRLSYQQVCAIQQQASGPGCVTPELCSDLQGNSLKGGICENEAYKMESNFIINQTTYEQSAECSSGSKIINTEAIRLNWFFRKDTKQQRRTSEDFIRKVFDKLFEEKEKFEGTVHLFSLVVQFDEYHSIVKKDSPFVGVTVALMTVFSVTVSLKIPGFLKSRSILAFSGVATTCLAIGSTIGVLAVLGVPFIEVAFLTPFIMLGQI